MTDDLNVPKKRGRPPKQAAPERLNDGLASALGQLSATLESLKQNQSAEREANLIGDAMKEATKPRVNQSPPRISAMNPQGDKSYPRPALNVDKIYIPYEAEPEDFTFEELELLNLVSPGEYWVTLNDGGRLMITIRATRNEITGRIEKMFFESAQAFNAENRQRLRPLTVMLREILGEKAEGVVSMAARRDAVATGALPVSMGD